MFNLLPYKCDMESVEELSFLCVLKGLTKINLGGTFFKRKSTFVFVYIICGKHNCHDNDNLVHKRLIYCILHMGYKVTGYWRYTDFMTDTEKPYTNHGTSISLWH